MELFIFARFHARDGEEASLAALLRDAAARTRREPGCVTIAAYRGLRDSRLFFIHSHWLDEAAFQVHADLPATIAFAEAAQALIDHPLDVVRSAAI
jgi:quinol monooxygenase YgiN